MLNTKESIKLLKKYDLPIVNYQIFDSISQISNSNFKLKFPVVLKVLSPSIIHKTEFNAVKLNIKTLSDLKQIATELLIKLKKNIKNFKLDKILVQEMFKGTELILGSKIDPTFGKVMILGIGGTYVEILKDVVIRKVPLTKTDCKNMIDSIKNQAILDGFRGSPKVDRDELTKVLYKFSSLISKESFSEIDINPIMVSGKDIKFVDFRFIEDNSTKFSKTKVHHSNLDLLFNPNSIAIIGASKTPGTVGNDLIKNLKTGGVYKSKYSKSFKGIIYPINPKYSSIEKLKCYPSISKIGSNVDLAIISVPAKIVPKIVEDCGLNNVKNIIIISAGFSEIGHEGLELENKVIEISKKYNINIVGPNCLGIINTYNNMNSSFALTTPSKGNISLISQSGAFINSIIDESLINNFGFSKIISCGNNAQLDIPDYIEYLSKDKNTKVISIYLEGLNNGSRFFEVCKKVSKIKPIVLLKSGRSKRGIAAAMSHTGSIAGDYLTFKSICIQAGVHIADDLEDLLEISKILSFQPKLKNNKIAIITNGGGAGVLTSDFCEKYNFNLVKLSKSSLLRLDDFSIMHKAYSRSNPLDLVGDALPNRYELGLSTLLNQKDISGIVVILTIQTMTKPLETAKIIVKQHKLHPDKPIITIFFGGQLSLPSIAYLEKNKMPNFNSPKQAIKTLRHLL